MAAALRGAGLRWWKVEARRWPQGASGCDDGLLASTSYPTRFLSRVFAANSVPVSVKPVGIRKEHSEIPEGYVFAVVVGVVRTAL